MSSVEDRLHAAMSAAADQAAREIRSAPPLRLPAGPAAGDRRRRAPTGPTRDRWIRWAAPLTAAAVVVALAIALVLVKDIPNGSAVPSNPTSSAVPGPSTGPGGVPRYFVALSEPGGNQDKPLHIVVGDAVTGKTLATFAPPKDTTFSSVTAAADDRTFIVSALQSSNGTFVPPGEGTVTARWYEVRLAPGTANPVRLISLPIEPQPAGQPPLFPSFNAALSSSGQELAVADYTAWNGMAVKVFSVATGRLLHDWTFTDPSISSTPPKGHGPDWSGAAMELPTMTWIDGDRTLVLATPDLTHLSSASTIAQTLRELNVAGPTNGDLLADSKVVWVGPIVKYPADLVQSPAEVLQECTESPGSDLVISGNGKTFSCTGQSPSDGYTQSFRTYPITLSTTAAEQGQDDYQVTQAEAQGLDTPMVLWSSPSGAAIIAGWNTYAKGTLTDEVGGLHIGVISHGKFTPLRFPKGFTLTGSADIAW